MRLLLDTQVALWALVDDARLNADVRQRIAKADTQVWISAASLWEIAIKHSLGRGDMPISARQALAYFETAGYRLLPASAEHCAATAELPALHHDPFDRLLVAQALFEPLRLVTHDPQVARYSDTVWLI